MVRHLRSEDNHKSCIVMSSAQTSSDNTVMLFSCPESKILIVTGPALTPASVTTSPLRASLLKYWQGNQTVIARKSCRGKKLESVANNFPGIVILGRKHTNTLRPPNPRWHVK